MSRVGANSSGSINNGYKCPGKPGYEVRVRFILYSIRNIWNVAERRQKSGKNKQVAFH